MQWNEFYATLRMGKNFLLHSMIASYIEDMPESEGLLSVKHGDRTAMPSHVCMVKREVLEGSSVAPKWCWKKVVTIPPNNSNLKNVTKSETRHSEEMSIFSGDPVLAKLSFMGINSSMSEHAIIRFEPLHNV